MCISETTFFTIYHDTINFYQSDSHIFKRVFLSHTVLVRHCLFYCLTANPVQQPSETVQKTTVVLVSFKSDVKHLFCGNTCLQYYANIRPVINTSLFAE